MSDFEKILNGIREIKEKGYEPDGFVINNIQPAQVFSLMQNPLVKELQILPVESITIQVLKKMAKEGWSQTSDVRINSDNEISDDKIKVRATLIFTWYKLGKPQTEDEFKTEYLRIANQFIDAL
jgi:hypothetical protein